MPHTRKEKLSIGREVADRIFHGKKNSTATVKGYLTRSPLDGLMLTLDSDQKAPVKRIVEWDNEHGYWDCGGYCQPLPDNLFPDVKWEDDEPTPCKITIEI